MKAYRAQVRRDNWTNFSVLRHRAFDGILVSSKNSGTHWLKYMFAVALAHQYNLPAPEYFSEEAVRPYIGHPKDKPVFEGMPRLAFGHTIPHRLMDWPWAWSLAAPPPYILLVRHPMDILASHYAKWADELGGDWLTFLRGDPSGQRYRCDIFWLARFWNRWGAIRAQNTRKVRTLTYEDSLQAPATALRAMAGHWRIKLGDEALDKALRAGTKAEMAKKVDPNGERNVLQNRATARSDLFRGEAMDIYQSRVEVLFKHRLGYELLNKAHF